MKPRHKYIEHLIDTLQEVAPTAFPKKPLPKVPLSHRQHKAIQAILDVDWHTADTVLSWWCQGRRYDKACSVEGVPRYRVDGKVGGVVTTHDAQWNKDNLDEYYATRLLPRDIKYLPRSHRHSEIDLENYGISVSKSVPVSVKEVCYE